MSARKSIKSTSDSPTPVVPLVVEEKIQQQQQQQNQEESVVEVESEGTNTENQETALEEKDIKAEEQNVENVEEDTVVKEETETTNCSTTTVVEEEIKEEIKEEAAIVSETLSESAETDVTDNTIQIVPIAPIAPTVKVEKEEDCLVKNVGLSPQLSPVDFPSTPSASASLAKDRKRRPTSTSQSNVSTPSCVTKKDRAEDDGETDVEDDKSIISTTSSTTVNSDVCRDKETPTPTPTIPTIPGVVGNDLVIESPTKSKKRRITYDKSAIVTRKTKQDLITAAAAAQSGRSLRAGPRRNTSESETTPSAVYITKRKYVRRATVAATSTPTSTPTSTSTSTATKRKRTDSASSKTQEDKEDPDDSKKIAKMEKEIQEQDVVKSQPVEQTDEISEKDTNETPIDESLLNDDQSDGEESAMDESFDSTFMTEDNDNAEALVEKRRTPTAKKCTKLKETSKSKSGGGAPRAEKRTGTRRKSMVGDDSMNVENGKDSPDNLAYVKPKRGRPKKTEMLLTTPKRRRAIKKNQTVLSRSSEDLTNATVAALPTASVTPSQSQEYSPSAADASTILIIATAPNPADTVVTRFDNFQNSPDDGESKTGAVAPITTHIVSQCDDTALPPSVAAVTPTVNGVDADPLTIMLPKNIPTECPTNAGDTGVSMISVSQFYKKPEFIENDFGKVEDDKEIVNTNPDIRTYTASQTNQRSVQIRTSARRRSMEQNKQTVPVKTYRTYRKAPRAEAKKVEPQLKNDNDNDNDNDIDEDKDMNKHVSDSETTDQSKADTTLDETKILSDSLSQLEIDGLLDESDTKAHDDANVGDSGNNVVGDGDGDEIKMSNEDDDNSFSNKCDNEILAVVPESKDHQDIDEMNVKDTENQNDNDNDNDNEDEDEGNEESDKPKSTTTNTQLNRRSSSLSSKPSTSNYPKRSYPAYTRNSTSTLTPDKTAKSKWMEEDNEDTVPLTNILSPSSVREKTHIIVKRDYLSDIKNKEKQINKQQDIENVNNENVIENSSCSSSNNKSIVTSSVRTRRSTQSESNCTNNNMRKTHEITDEVNIDRNYCTDIKTDKDNDCDDIVKREITHDNDHIIDVEIKDTSKSECNFIDETNQLKENKENIKDHLDTMKNDHDDNHQDDNNDKTNIIFNIDSVQIIMEDVPSSIKKLQETPETLKQKENHLKSLGLLTHKAAVQAQIEKQRRREMLKSTIGKIQTTGSEGNEQDHFGGQNLNDSSDNDILKNTNDNNSSKDIGNNTITTSSCSNGDGNSPTNGGQGNSNNKNSQEYTGTLKTVIKLNRQASNNQSNEKRNKTTVVVVGGVGGGNRLPLKMTFQKGRGRGGAHLDKDHSNTTATTGEESYYTIQNEAENTHQEAVTHGRKSHNRSHTTESTTQGGDANTSTQPAATGVGGDKKDGPKDHILIPEKASSFSIHPDRLCQDQCFYCGGKFGLYDTPCHVAQIKSLERQQKILENEEKLTVDYCLCDACFRHVARRANCPAYKKRVSGPSHLEPNSGSNDATETTNQIDNNGDTDKPISNPTATNQNQQTINRSVCFVYDCNERATHSLRRKRLRKTIRKLLPNEYNMFNGLIPICDKHYEVIYHFMECALCKRRLIRNHVFHITHDVLPKLEKLLIAKGFPVHFRDNTVVCKLCKYFTKLLLKPPEGKSQKALFVKNYRRRLLNLYNIQTEDKDDDDEGENSEIEEEKPIEATSSTKSSTNDDSNKDDSIAISVQKRRRKQKLSTPPIVPTTNETSNNHRDDTQSSDDCNIQQQQLQQPQQTSIIAGSGQIALDNDVMVDYDVPILDDEVASSSSSPPPQPPTPSSSSSSSLLQNQSMRNMSLPSSTVVTSKLQSILQGGGGGGSGSSGCSSVKDDISIALRSNPNISMRELFPGEEEMGLQVGLPFGGSTSHKTPEGWTRVQTFLQYDEPTRRLWEDLQKPYGNQSSFLRHLILLEKYFRNGDLILSQNASSNAVVYSESVQNRLRSFDNINERNRRKSNNSENNRSINSKQINDNTSITITARPKSSSSSTNATSPSSSSTLSYNNNNQTIDSILKTNLLGNKNSSIEILPINSNDSSNDSSTNSNNCGGNSLTKQQKLLAAASRLIHNDDTNGRHSNSSGSKKNGYNPINNNNCNNGSNISSSSSTISYPPELISINQGSNSLLLANNKNQQHNYQSYSSQNSYSSLSQMSNVSGGGSGVGQHHSSNHIPSKLTKLRDTLTSAEIAQGKSWRPTLMPIKSVPAHLIRKDELYETVDGRRLPAFVQVQSGHRPYLISIYDYNRMCMMRRDKIEQALKVTNSNSCSSTTTATSSSSTTTNNNYNNNCNNSHNITATIDLETEFNTKPMSQHYQQQQQHHHQHRMHQQQIQNKLQIPNKILEQNSLLPISMTNRHQRSYSGEQKPMKRILPKPSSSLLVPLVPSKHSNQTQHQHQQQQQQQMQQHPSQPSVAPAQTEITATTASSNMVSLIPNISAVFLGSQKQQQQQQQQNQFMQQGPKASTSWLWSNNTGDNNVNTNGMVIPSSNNNNNHNRTPGATPAAAAAAVAATAVGIVAASSLSNSSSPLGGITKQQQNSKFNNNNSSSLILDDSLLLKIPKSLTVIPQQKGHGRLNSRMNSMEDANSA